jgi:hypothetical protein
MPAKAVIRQTPIFGFYRMAHGFWIIRFPPCADKPRVTLRE